MTWLLSHWLVCWKVYCLLNFVPNRRVTHHDIFLTFHIVKFVFCYTFVRYGRTYAEPVVRSSAVYLLIFHSCCQSVVVVVVFPQRCCLQSLPFINPHLHLATLDEDNVKSGEGQALLESVSPVGLSQHILSRLLSSEQLNRVQLDLMLCYLAVFTVSVRWGFESCLAILYQNRSTVRDHCCTVAVLSLNGMAS